MYFSMLELQPDPAMAAQAQALAASVEMPLNCAWVSGVAIDRGGFVLYWGNDLWLDGTGHVTSS